MMPGTAQGAGPAAAPKRVFIEAWELPGLLLGALRGEPRALRRIVGARRGGRYGLLLAAVGLLAAAPLAWWPGLWLAHALFSGIGWPLARRRGLGPRANQRPLLWLCGAFLLLVAPLRLLSDSPLAALAALGLAHGAHARHLRNGLASAGEAAADFQTAE